MNKIVLLLMPLFLMSSCRDKISDKKLSRNKVISDSLTGELEALHQKGYFTGFAVAIVNDKGILYEKGIGYANAETHQKYTAQTLQPIASISKTIIGVALMKAVEMGKINLDDPVNNYLPFKVINPNFPKLPITLRHLATHTSGISDTQYYLDHAWILKNDTKTDTTGLGYPQKFNPPSKAIAISDFLKNILVEGKKWYSKEGFLKFEPGTRYEYSNIGATLAAYAIENATGVKFDAFTNKYILKPLGMKSSGWSFDTIDLKQYSVLYKNPGRRLPDYGIITYPDGGFISSAEDMGKYLCELVKGYFGNGTILSPEGYKELYTWQLGEKNFEERNVSNPYNEEFNMGIFIGGSYKGYIGHTGGDAGVSSIMFFDPKTRTGRFLMINTNFDTKEGNDAFYDIWNNLELYGSKFKPE